MKAIIVLVVVLLASCSPFGFNPEGYEVLSEPLEVAWPKAAALKYIPDSSPADEWKSPHETMEDGGGDCEDIATYFMYLLGTNSEMVVINNDHAIVYYGGRYLEPAIYGEWYKEENIIITDRHSYESVMKSTTQWGTQYIVMN